MPLSSVTRVSDGIQKQYDFDFGYLRKSHVFVFVNNELRSFKWLGPFQIELLNFPQPDDTVTIRRLTDRVNRITTFTDGQTILAEDLNAADLQTFYIAQEMLDQIEERILAGEVSVIGSGYITAQWIQEQLAANIAGSTQFQAISDALDNEALARANALAAEASARAAEIAAEAAARGAAVFDLKQADLEAGQRLDVLEADVNDATTGIKARIGTLETVTVGLENNKADASVVSAIQAAVDAAGAQIATIDEALATETAARTSQINAANSRIDGAEASLTTLGVTVTNLQTGKAEASDLSALSAEVAFRAGSATEALNRNPTFSIPYTGLIAPGWNDWANGQSTYYGHPTQPDRRGMAQFNTSALTNMGVVQEVNLLGYTQLLLRATVRRLGGSFSASGVLVYWYNSSGGWLGESRLKFSTAESVKGVVGNSPDGTNTWELLLTAPAGAAFVNLYAMTAWDGHSGDSPVAGEALWYECGLYPAGSSAYRAAKARADIITESSARASGDSANATTIEQNRAAFQRQQDFPNLLTDAELSGAWQNYWDPASDRDYPGLVTRGHNLPGWFVPGVRNVAYDILYTTSTTDGFTWASRRPKPQYRPKVQEGDRVYASIRAAGHRLKGAILSVVFWNASGSVIGVEQFSNYDPTYFAFGAVGAARESFALISGLATAPAGAVTADIIVWFVTKGAADTPDVPYGWWTEPMLSRVEPSFSGTIPWSRQAASVTSLREALATGSSSIARLLLGVNTTTNVATIEAVAAEGEGVWNGSAITLQANLVKLLAQDIQFGSRTQFEDGRGTIYNTEAGKRLRLLGPFGASNDLVLWYGNSSVALQSETKTNGVFAIATDGLVYLGNQSLSQPMSLAASTPRSDIRPGGGSRGVSVTITPSGGRGPYTYQHELVSWTGSPKPSINNTTVQTFGVTAPASGARTEVTYTVVSTVTDADGRTAQRTTGGALIWTV